MGRLCRRRRKKAKLEKILVKYQKSALPQQFDILVKLLREENMFPDSLIYEEQFTNQQKITKALNTEVKGHDANNRLGVEQDHASTSDDLSETSGDSMIPKHRKQTTTIADDENIYQAHGTTDNLQKELSKLREEIKQDRYKMEMEIAALKLEKQRDFEILRRKESETRMPIQQNENNLTLQLTELQQEKQKDHDRLTRQITELQQEKQQDHDTCRLTRQLTELQQKQRDYDRLTRQLTELQQEKQRDQIYDRRDQHIVSMEKAMNSKTTELQRKEAGQISRHSELNLQIRKLQDKTETLSADIGILQLENTDLKSKLGEKEKEVQDCWEKNDTLSSNFDHLQSKHNSMQEELSGQIEKLKVDVKKKSTSIQELQDGKDSLLDQLDALMVNNDQLTQELKTEQQKHHTTRTDLGEQIASLRGDNNVLSSTVEMLQRNVGVLEKQLGVSEDKLQTLRLNKDQMKSELDTEQQKHHTTRTELGEQIVSLRGDNNVLSSTFEKLHRNVEVLEGQLGMLELHWRVEPIFDQQYLKNLKDEVEQYWPLRDMGVSVDSLQHVNILLIGPIGAGKSSFLNSVESTFRGHVTLTATAGSRTKSVTSMYRQHSVLASDNRHPMKFRLCDCRGLEDRFGISRDIDSILEGNMPDGYVFNNSFPFTRKTHGYKHNPSLEDRIHCVVYVLDAETYSKELGVPFVSEPVRNQIKTMQEAIDQRGIPQLAILSKVDNICESTKQNTAMVYRSPAIRQRCIDAAGCLGLPPMTVMPMKNYFWETSTTDDISILALYNIRQMLRAADSFLRANHLDELRADKHK